MTEYRVMYKSLFAPAGAPIELTAYPTEREALDRAFCENEKEEGRSNPPELVFYVRACEALP